MKKIILFVIFLLLSALFMAPIIIYKQMFNKRFTTPMHEIDITKISSIKRKKYEFPSNQNQTLVGYHYYLNKNPKGVIIFSHGLGGGHRGNLPIINYFVKNNYSVFAYDSTACDESEGKVFGGINQAVIDLEYVINFVENEDDFKGMPILLLGHSMGGYATMSVLNKKPEIKGVVSVSGFNKLTDMIQSTVEEELGSFGKFMLPPIMLYERLKFKEYAQFTSEKGIINSDAKLFIIHSEDDEVVNKKFSYDVYYNLYQNKYKNTDKIKFKLYKNKGHNYIFYKQDKLEEILQFYRNEFNQFNENDEKMKEKQVKDEEGLSKSVWLNGIDTKMLDEILQFYDDVLGVKK